MLGWALSTLSGNQLRAGVSLTLQSSGGGKSLVDVGRQERLECGPRPHVHTSTDVEVGVNEEGKTAQEASPGTEEWEHRNGTSGIARTYSNQ